MKELIILILTLLIISCNKEEGCMDSNALNYNSDATIDNGDCEYANITNLNINFTQTVNGNTLILNEMIYTNQDDNYSIQTLRYLISDIYIHIENGDSTLIDEVHFIDLSIPESLTLNIPEIPNETYISISFNMGLNSNKNITNLFLNENFFPSFAWPEFLGGGYHYMQLEGDINTVFNGYATHTGGTNGIDYSFNKIFPIMIDSQSDSPNIHINMELANWYKNPHIYNLTTDGIMGDPNSQLILKDNGIEDVFSVD